MKKFTVSTLIIGGLVQLSSIFSVAKESGWLVVVCASAIIIPLCMLYGQLAEISGGDIFTFSFGKIPAVPVKILYLLFFLFSASIDIRQSSNIISGGMFPGLSPIVLPLLFAPVLFYGAVKDYRKVADLGFVLFIASALLTIPDFILQIRQIQLTNYLPLINTTTGNVVQMIFYCVTVVMGKIPVLLFLGSPGLKNEKGSAARRCFWGSLMGCLFLLLVALRDVGILGRLVSYMKNSVFETVQLLDAFGFLSRIEILFVFMHIVCITYTLCLWMGVSADIISGTFSLGKNKKPFVVAGLLIVSGVASIFLFRTSAILQDFLKNIFPFISVWFVVVLPVLALVFAGFCKKSTDKK